MEVLIGALIGSLSSLLATYLANRMTIFKEREQ
jgi:hypothetical protein